MDQVAQYLQPYGKKKKIVLPHIYMEQYQLLTVSTILIKRKDVESTDTAGYPSVVPVGPLTGHEEVGWK